MPAVRLRLPWVQKIFFSRATCGEKFRRPQADTPPLLLGCPFQGMPGYDFGFRLCWKTGSREREGQVPRNDVLTGGFIRFSFARTLTRIIFLVPRLRYHRNPEGVANQEGYLRCSKRFDHIGVTLQVLSLFEFKSVDERPREQWQEWWWCLYLCS